MTTLIMVIWKHDITYCILYENMRVSIMYDPWSTFDFKAASLSAARSSSACCSFLPEMSLVTFAVFLCKWGVAIPFNIYLIKLYD